MFQINSSFLLFNAVIRGTQWVVDTLPIPDSQNLSEPLENRVAVFLNQCKDYVTIVL